ncbi:MAG: response regulator [Desulfobacterota bacterium]|nr:response regulator [Thermodesulfobacteriota bacterium]
MVEKVKRAFILDRDEFLRLSLNKILKKYGFEVEEIEDLEELEKRKKEIKEGMIIADLDLETLDRWLPYLKRWNDRFILMTSLITDELSQRLKQIGLHRILKKPVEPKLLRKAIGEIPFPGEIRFPGSRKTKGAHSTRSERR